VRLRISTKSRCPVEETPWKRVSIASFGLKGPVPLWFPVPVVSPLCDDQESSCSDSMSSQAFGAGSQEDGMSSTSMPTEPGICGALHEEGMLKGVQIVVEAPKQGDAPGRVKLHGLAVDDGQVCFPVGHVRTGLMR
jgi:hypothetical protein